MWYGTWVKPGGARVWAESIPFEPDTADTVEGTGYEYDSSHQ